MEGTGAALAGAALAGAVLAGAVLEGAVLGAALGSAGLALGSSFSWCLAWEALCFLHSTRNFSYSSLAALVLVDLALFSVN